MVEQWKVKPIESNNPIKSAHIISNKSNYYISENILLKHAELIVKLFNEHKKPHATPLEIYYFSMLEEGIYKLRDEYLNDRHSLRCYSMQDIIEIIFKDLETLILKIDLIMNEAD